MHNRDWEAHDPTIDKMQNFIINTLMRICHKEGTLKTSTSISVEYKSARPAAKIG